MKIKLLLSKHCFRNCDNITPQLCGFKVKTLLDNNSYGYLCLRCGGLGWDREEAMLRQKGKVINMNLARFLLKVFLGKDENIVI